MTETAEHANTADQRDATLWHMLSPRDTVSHLGVDPEHGLSN